MIDEYVVVILTDETSEHFLLFPYEGRETYYALPWTEKKGTPLASATDLFQQLAPLLLLFDHVFDLRKQDKGAPATRTLLGKSLTHIFVVPLPVDLFDRLVDLLRRFPLILRQGLHMVVTREELREMLAANRIVPKVHAQVLRDYLDFTEPRPTSLDLF